MKGKGSMGPHQALQLTKRLFYGGFGIMLVEMVATMIIQEGATLVFGILFGAAMLCLLGGWAFGLICVRCPHCGKSLMAGTKIPRAIPGYCPHCGEALNDCD